MGSMRPFPGAADDEETVVDWYPENQKDLLMNHFDWSHQMDNVPTSLQVLYAQEDLWVLAALLNKDWSHLLRPMALPCSQHPAVPKPYSVLIR